MTAEIIPISAHEYHQRGEVSNSFLTTWKDNALRAIHELTHPRPATPALRLGNIIHCAVLEPTVYSNTYSAVPKLDRRTKVGKETWATLCDKYGEHNLVTVDDEEAIKGVVAAVQGHEKARNLFAQLKEREATIIWRDQETGLSCKCRIDAMCSPIVADLKTTDDASVEGFQDSIFKYGYHRQGAMYLRGCRAAGIDVKHYSIVAVEKEAPFGINVFSLGEDALEQGERELVDLMKQVKLWKDTGIVPGYYQNVIAASLPEWAWRRIEFEGANLSE